MNVCSIAAGLEPGPRRIRDLLMACAPDDAVAVFGGPERLTYGELRDAVDRRAGGLLAGGVGRGHRVTVGSAPAFEWWIRLLAAWSVGAVWTTADACRAGVEATDLGGLLHSPGSPPAGQLISARAAVRGEDAAILLPGASLTHAAVTALAIAEAARVGPEALARSALPPATGEPGPEWKTCLSVLAAGGAVDFGATLRRPGVDNGGKMRIS
jgi:hypothetical protein